MIITAELNARLRPMDRGEYFEDPLNEVLAERELGEVTGGGSLLESSGEISRCDLEIDLTDANEEAFRLVIQVLEKLGAPKGSRLCVSEQEERAIPFGVTEGLAVALQGRGLPPQVYKECDVNVVIEELELSLEGTGRMLSYWEGPSETVLYFYGDSVEGMRTKMAGFLASYPLCQGCRVSQIA